MNTNYKIANLKELDYDELKGFEDKIKMETGKDFILIAWEKNK